MKIIRNSGNDRVVDEMRKALVAGHTLDIASPTFSLFAFAELRQILDQVERTRLLLPTANGTELSLLGISADRPFRNRLQARWLAQQCVKWITQKVELRGAPTALPQSMLITGDSDSSPLRVITGNCPFTTDGLGMTPGNQFSLIQCSEGQEESAMLGAWFTALWNSLPASSEAKNAFLARLREIVVHKEPSLIYHQILFHLFKDSGQELDEERVAKSATGIRNTVVWKKLFKFQRDGVIGALDKLERLGGCIIADSVGLGKTFEALAIIKYYELRNDRVLVLCPNVSGITGPSTRPTTAATSWLPTDSIMTCSTIPTFPAMAVCRVTSICPISTGATTTLSSLTSPTTSATKSSASRTTKPATTGSCGRLSRKGLKPGSSCSRATPVNNRLADLKNQIAFVTEGDDTALIDHGIASVEATIRQAQLQFNRWLALDETERKPARLMDMLGFDYFTLLDLLTIARSRKHIQKYYGTQETGQFPERLKPVNIKPDVDRAGEFRSIRDINNEIRRLNLAAYAPLRYVLPHKQAAYDAKYSTQIRGGESFFRQIDREESLVHLLRVNVLKRMESAVSSFALTLQRQLADVEQLLAKIEAHADTVEELNIEDVDVDDSAFESLLVGRKVKVLLHDVDLVRWKQDLNEDRNRLDTLLSAARQVHAARDAKLEALRQVIENKVRTPLNPGNRKVIIFTAFADTAQYLYAELAPWAKRELGIHSALVTGAGRNQTTLPDLHKDLGTILTSFSPRSKERPEDLAAEGEIDLLFATDCISEGQNLQDCDYLVNYDIHWNPVRIIQRFGRIDRIGSVNARIQLVNFWPNIELEEYINLEQRVSGRMVLLDISATGEENIIEQESGNQMNDLEYRRKQLLKLQDAVIDLEDLSSGVSIADLTLTDFRIDLAGYLKDNQARLESLPVGSFAVTTTNGNGGTDTVISPGVIFCLRAESAAAVKSAEPGYPLAPHYLVHVGQDGAVLLPYTQAKQVLDRLKKLSIGRDLPDAAACARFDKVTANGENMIAIQKLLGTAVASIVGKKEERAVASLFTPGGTHAMKGEFAGINDFEVVAFLVVLPEQPA